MDDNWRNVMFGDELTMPELQIQRHEMERHMPLRVVGAEPMPYGEYLARQAACEHVWSLGRAGRLAVRYCEPCQTYQLQSPSQQGRNRS